MAIGQSDGKVVFFDLVKEAVITTITTPHNTFDGDAEEDGDINKVAKNIFCLDWVLPNTISYVKQKQVEGEDPEGYPSVLELPANFPQECSEDSFLVLDTFQKNAKKRVLHVSLQQAHLFLATNDPDVDILRREPSEEKSTLFEKDNFQFCVPKNQGFEEDANILGICFDLTSTHVKPVVKFKSAEGKQKKDEQGPTVFPASPLALLLDDQGFLHAFHLLDKRNISKEKVEYLKEAEAIPEAVAPAPQPPTMKTMQSVDFPLPSFAENNLVKKEGKKEEEVHKSLQLQGDSFKEKVEKEREKDEPVKKEKGEFNFGGPIFATDFNTDFGSFGQSSAPEFGFQSTWNAGLSVKPARNLLQTRR